MKYPTFLLSVTVVALSLSISCTSLSPQETSKAKTSSLTSPLGTDIDHSVGSVAWDQVKATGTSWVYCKVNGGYSNKDWDFQDPRFASYWPQLEKAQLSRGAYCFFDLETDGLSQAKLFVKLLNQAGGLKANDLPPCLDIEWTPTPSSTPFPTSSAWKEEALKWLNYVEAQTGRIPVIYTDDNMARKNFDKRFVKFPLWVASYPTEDEIKPNPNPYPNSHPKGLGPWNDNWTIWQYSQTGTIAGIGPGQDLDFMKISVKDFVTTTTK